MDITIILYILVIVILMYLLRPRNDNFIITGVLRDRYSDPDAGAFGHSPAL